LTDAFLQFNESDVLRVSKKEADASAEKEYTQFAAKRRALLESEGAEDNVNVLEAAAKALPKSNQPKKKISVIDGDQENLTHLERSQNQADQLRPRRSTRVDTRPVSGQQGQPGIPARTAALGRRSIETVPSDLRRPAHC
jgi:hypothetical protein